MQQFSRRKLFAVAAAVPFVASVASAQEAAVAAPSREDDLKNARERMARNAAELAKVEVPMATEPAFSFKA